MTGFFTQDFERVSALRAALRALPANHTRLVIQRRLLHNLRLALQLSVHYVGAHNLLPAVAHDKMGRTGDVLTAKVRY